MSDWKYVGSTAAAKLVALVKAAINSKADKTNATTSVAGLMSAADKAKLDGIAEGATKITVDSELSSSSANPVMNGTIAVALSGKADQANVFGKLDKTGGTITGNLKLAKTSEDGTGSIDVEGNISAMSGTTRLWRVYVTNNVDSDQQFKAPLFVLSDPLSQKSVQAKQDGNAAVKIECFDESISKGYARLKIGMPTEDEDATPKAYVDSKIASGGVTVDTALDAGSVNPVQNKVIKSALDNKMDKSGGTMTGNLIGQYITGTWLQTTAATDLGKTPGKIAVLDDSGWLYHRTPAELLADIGAATVSAMLDKAYPVGAIYMSVNSTNPKTLFGGTWVQIKDKFLLASGDTYKAGTTGGEAAHALTADEMPNHQHVLWYPNAGGEQSAAIGYPEAGSKNTWYAEASKTGGAGGGAAHNNMPPYLAVYVWKRTA